MYQVKSNRTTNHIDGIDVRSTGTGEERDGAITYYATSTCGTITRNGHRMTAYAHHRFDNLADALASARRGTRKICKTCEKAAESALATEQAKPEPTSSKPLTITPARRALLQEVADGRVYKYPSGRCSYVAVPGEKTKTVTAAMNILTDAGLVKAVRDSRLSDVWDYELTENGRAVLAPATADQPSTLTEAEMVLHIDHTGPGVALATLTSPNASVPSRQARLGNYYGKRWYADDGYSDNPGNPIYVTSSSARAAARKWLKALGLDPDKITITEDREH